MSRSRSLLVALGFLLAVGARTPANVIDVPTGTWMGIGGTSTGRNAATAVLADGRVLIAGGEGADGPLATADLFAGDSLVPAAPMHHARAGHAAVTLADGRVLVAGGRTADGAPTGSAEIYDPATNAWSDAGPMATPRVEHTATALPDGRVLVAGGEAPDALTATLETFDPASNSFAGAGSLATARARHAAVSLYDGRVLIVGGFDGAVSLASTEIFDPVTGGVSAGPSLSVARDGHTATRLLDERILVVGGHDGPSDLASAELYVPGMEAFVPTAPLGGARRDHLAVLLPHNNAVLIAGGRAGDAALASAELFLPWSETFVPAAAPGAARAGASGAPTAAEGHLLVAGGDSASSAELYGFQTVRTDKSDYSPGENDEMTGRGWQPGEAVTLLLKELPATHADRTFTAVVDAAGRLENNEFIVEEHDYGVTFLLTATGASSGLVSMTRFTDSHSITALFPASFVQTPSDVGLTVVGSGLDSTCSVPAVLTSGPVAAWLTTTSSALHSVGATIPGALANTPGTYSVAVYKSTPAWFCCSSGCGSFCFTCTSPHFSNSLPLTIVAANQPPVANNDTYGATEDVPRTVAAPGVLGNDSDPNGNPIAAQLVAGPAHGTLTLNGNGAFSYTPSPDFFGSDSFTYRATDGGQSSDVATVSITVAPLNDPPFFSAVAPRTTSAIAGPLTSLVSGLVPGPSNESSQTVTLSASSSDASVVSNPTVSLIPAGTLTPVYFGGAGDQRGAGIAIVGPALYISGEADANGGDGLVAAYPLPLVAPSPVWSEIWPSLGGPDRFAGVAASTEGAYVAGASWSRTSDTADGKESKGIVVKFPLLGPPGGGFDGAIWDRQTPPPPGAFPFGGGESLAAVATAVEGGQPYAYAAGSSQSSDGNTGRLYLSKLDAAGNMVWTLTDSAATTLSRGAAVASLGGSIYVAGRNDDDGTMRPYLLKYSSSGNLLWSRKTTTLPGQYLGLTALGGALYAVGQRSSGGGSDFLIEKWDEDGNKLWSQQYDRSGAEDVFYGVVGRGSQLYAVGSTRGGTLGGSDVIIMELDPATGASLSSTLWGGAEDDIARGAATDGNDVYVVGETRSFTSDGNAAGQNDVVILRYTPTDSASLNYTPLRHGTATITVIANDGQPANNTFSRTFTVTVANAAPAAGNDSLATNEDTPATLDVRTNDTDLDGDPLTVTIVSQGAHGAVSLNPDGTVTYTPAADYFGPDSFVYRIADGQGGTANGNVIVTVSPVNDPPVAVPDTATVVEDSSNTAIDVLANDHDGVDQGETLTVIAATQPSHGSTTFTATGVAYTPSPDYFGSDSFTYTISDGNGGSVTATVTVTVTPVNDAPVVEAGAAQTVNEGATVSLAPATFTDVDAADTHTATITWGDGTAAEAGLVTEGAGAGSVAGNHVYADNGTYTVSVCVTDGDGAQTCDSLAVTVLNVAPTVNAGLDATLGEGGTFASSGSFSDAGTDTWTATVDYGDGSGAQPLALGSGPAFSFNHGYVQDGVYTVTVTVRDDDGGSGTDTATVTVTNVVPAWTAAAAAPTAIDEDGTVTLTGSFVDPGLNDGHTVTVNWGEGAPEAVAVSPVSAGVFSFSATHRYLDDRPTGTASDSYTIAVTVTDDDGGVSGNQAVTVANVTPVMTAVAGPGPLALGAPATIGVTFADVGTQDTHVCTFSWDDGQAASTVAASGGTCTATHVYAGPGVYTVLVTLEDDDTGRTESRYEFVVVYDPNDGFVTGGGWIMSPAGAYAADADLTGKATFGFVSKYKRGATVPSGQTEFQFHAGGFNFHSSVYEWLVVAGAKAQFKGSGTVNGSGDYGFLLTATDGDASGGGNVDKFRIKIWDKVTGGVVYDNKRGTADDLDAADPQAISGGSIVVRH